MVDPLIAYAVVASVDNAIHILRWERLCSRLIEWAALSDKPLPYKLLRGITETERCQSRQVINHQSTANIIEPAPTCIGVLPLLSSIALKFGCGNLNLFKFFSFLKMAKHASFVIAVESAA